MSGVIGNTDAVLNLFSSRIISFYLVTIVNIFWVSSKWLLMLGSTLSAKCDLSNFVATSLVLCSTCTTKTRANLQWNLNYALGTALKTMFCWRIKSITETLIRVHFPCTPLLQSWLLVWISAAPSAASVIPLIEFPTILSLMIHIYIWGHEYAWAL